MSQRLGKYIIESLIAEGGMARIYRAKTEGVGGIDKVVAIKCIRDTMRADDSFVQMLLDEARITVRMTHKNICQVYGLEHDGDTYFLVMEYVDGISLDKLFRWVLQTRGGLPIEAAVYIVMEVCAGLSYAHRITDDDDIPLGIVHRDVNPQNICLSKEGEVKLIDFGIAKAKKESTETQVGTIKGKFNYMSPEQARGDRVDQRADIFALGAVLYELLSGHMLYPLSLDDQHLRSKARMADFEPIENYVPNIPQKLKKILNKALARDLTQRFATSRDFLLALTQFSHDECDVYDSLNLSSLVKHCINDTPSMKSGLKKVPSNDVAKVQAPKFSLSPSELANELDRTTDASITSIENSLERSDTVSDLLRETDQLLGEIEDGPTALYKKSDFLAYEQKASAKSKKDMTVINRLVDLEVDKPNDDETVMFKLNDVSQSNQSAPGILDKISHTIRPYLEKLSPNLSKVTEKTLHKIIIALTTILALVIIVIVAINNDDPQPSENIQITDTQLTGSILIETEPSRSDIYIDGKRFDRKTPTDIPRNSKNVVIKHKFYQDQPVNLSKAAGEDQLTFKLVPITGQIFIKSSPIHARVYINDEVQQSETPMRREVKMDEETTIRVELAGYQPQKRTITPESWETEDQTQQTVDFILKPVNQE